ncbi:MAG: DNA-3-methyladenine glycosylase I [Methylococcales bacterium]|nr:DNA-3-methyladenine glycosylase I [Methylococcales bacterium]
MVQSYCQSALNEPEYSVHQRYHDTEYGFPLTDDNQLFARLVLEINQAGLSWTTILKKAANFHLAYHDFDIATVANDTETDRLRLIADAGIIRNRLKINAAIVNAQRLLVIQQEYSSFNLWLDNHRSLTKEQWTTLFKKTFLFTGGEIVNEFLMSTAYLSGAHEEDCPIYAKTARL